ncbi:MAG: hypothetical protein HGB26_01385 [Desulfobulbaceae bacterium]|nr:hypothetical protein [Desulfobulbaceae bacterium]
MFTAHYYDLIAINSLLCKEKLRLMIEDGKLEQHCHEVKIQKASPYAKIQKHEGTIILYQATDQAIEVLNEKGFSNYPHSISRIEVARDLIFNNSLGAGKYLSALQNTYYVKWGKDIFAIGKNKYIGKEYGNRRGMYVSCYDPGVKKFGMAHNVHTEFRLFGKGVILDKLKVDRINDLQSAEDTFNKLADKYLMRAVTNRDRFKIYFPEAEANNFEELIEIVKGAKERIRARLEHRILLGLLCGGKWCQRMGVDSLHTLPKRDKLLLKQGVTYFLRGIK